MYITNKGHTYYRGSEQCHTKAPFLILVDTPQNRNVRALVRMVALQQCGHWMMGKARAFGETIPISGAYGADGLIREVSEAVYAKATPLPYALYWAWKKGGGWNSTGSEAQAMAEWAKSRFLCDRCGGISSRFESHNTCKKCKGGRP